MFTFSRARYLSSIAKKCIHSVQRTCHLHSENCPGRAPRLVLGIETSCDDTAAAVVDEHGTIRGEGHFRQMQIHLDNGGIIPPLARDLHAQHIDDVVKTALKNSGCSLNDLSAIAATVKPGLELCLLVGLHHARKLVKDCGKPFIPIHHMQAHALTARMIYDVPFPFVVLLASGGHCLLAVVRNVDDFLLLGTTKDNAPGEIMDKIARRTKLKNIPELSNVCGGRAIEIMAEKGDPKAFPFPISLAFYRDCNFSFSGLQHTAEKIIWREEEEYGVIADGIIPHIADLCASLQHAIANHMTKRVQRAFIYCQLKNLIPEDGKCLVVSGGVACNSYIRGVLQQLGEYMDFKLICPPPHLCTDNGIMIAWNGIEKLKAGIGITMHPESVDIARRCPIGEDLTEDVAQCSIKLERFKIRPPVKQSSVA